MDSVEEIWKRLPYTTILSEEGSREVLDEMARPPKDTPERRRTFEGVREITALRQRQAEAAKQAEHGSSFHPRRPIAEGIR